MLCFLPLLYLNPLSKPLPKFWAGSTQSRHVVIPFSNRQRGVVIGNDAGVSVRFQREFVRVLNVSKEVRVGVEEGVCESVHFLPLLLFESHHCGESGAREGRATWHKRQKKKMTSFPN